LVREADHLYISTKEFHMLVQILFIVDMFLWLLTLIPYPAVAPYVAARSVLAFIAVLLLGIVVFVPAWR